MRCFDYAKQGSFRLWFPDRCSSKPIAIFPIKSQLFSPSTACSFRHLSPLVVEDPSLDAVKQAGAVIHRNDAPILAAAIESHVDFLITWNTRDFKRKSVQTYARFPILTPGEFLETFRQSILSAD
jgi:hypothetical protein